MYRGGGEGAIAYVCVCVCVCVGTCRHVAKSGLDATVPAVHELDPLVLLRGRGVEEVPIEPVISVWRYSDLAHGRRAVLRERSERGK